MISGDVLRSASQLLLLWMLVTLTACTALPQSQDEPGETDTSAAGEEPSQDYVVFDEQPVITCPEPEPVVAPSCPSVQVSKCPVCPTSKLDDKLLVGEVEKVKVSPPEVVYTARIDSGAAGTSLHATDITRFERDGENWVRFTIDNPDGEPITLEREVIRRVRIKQVELDDFERRLVVRMTLSLGSITEQVEMSLTDRSEMEYPVLIGRNFLRNTAIVDVSQEFIAK